MLRAAHSKSNGGTFQELGRFCQFDLYGRDPDRQKETIRLGDFPSIEAAGPAILRVINAHYRALKPGGVAVSLLIRKPRQHLRHIVVVEHNRYREGSALEVDTRTIPGTQNGFCLFDVSPGLVSQVVRRRGGFRELLEGGAHRAFERDRYDHVVPRPQRAGVRLLIGSWFDWGTTSVVDINLGPRPNLPNAQRDALSTLTRYLPDYPGHDLFDVRWNIPKLGGKSFTASFNFGSDTQSLEFIDESRLQRESNPNRNLYRPSLYRGVSRRTVRETAAVNGDFEALTSHGAIQQTAILDVELGRQKSYVAGSRAAIQALAHQLKSNRLRNLRVFFEYPLSGNRTRRVAVEYSPMTDGGQLWMHEALPEADSLAKPALERCFEEVTSVRIQKVARMGQAIEALGPKPSLQAHYRLEIKDKPGRVRLLRGFKVLWSKAVPHERPLEVTWSADHKSVVIEEEGPVSPQFWIWREGFPLAHVPLPSPNDYNMTTLWSPDGRTLLVRPGGSGAADMGPEGSGALLAIRLQRHGVPTFQSVGRASTWKVKWRDRRTVIYWETNDFSTSNPFPEKPQFWRVY